LTASLFLAEHRHSGGGRVITLKRRAWSMPALSLLLVLPPCMVYAASSLFSADFGNPAGWFPQPWLQNGAAEAAGRTKAIAAFLLFTGMAIGALVIWVSSFRLLDRRSAARLLIAYLLTVGAGSLAVYETRAFDGAPYLDQAFACASLNRLDPTPQEQQADAVRSPDRMTRLSGNRLDRVENCRAPQFQALRWMISVSAGLLLFGMPGMIFGAITCLAAPTTGSTKPRLDAWALQTRRLNAFLYLTATYMVSGLLFANAQLSWIGYSLHPDDLGPYRAYVGAIVLHSGISNSLMIASYYLPVALWLAAIRPPQPSPAAADSRSAEAEAPNPFGPLKIAGTILAPALVGFLGELLKL
jgi:hypothetical protein